MFNFNLGDKHVAREQLVSLTCSGGAHEQICDPTFDPGDLCDFTGDRPDGRTSEGRVKQQQEAQEACSEAYPKKSGLQWLLVCRSSVARDETDARSGLPWQWTQLRLQGMA